MAKYTLTVRCNEEDCKECLHYCYDNRKDYKDAVTRYENWKCTRHSDSSRPQIMSIGSLKKEKMLVNSMGKNGDFLYWKNEKGKFESGFQSGPGFKVWSKDFPEGAILKITAEIILPKN